MFDSQDIEVTDVSSRENWLSLRKADVTASAVAALFGVHEYQTALGLYMLKSGQVSEDPEETPAMLRGRLLEPVAVQLIQEKNQELRLRPRQGQQYYRHKAWRLGATPDSIWECPDRGLGVVQIKSVEPFIFKNKWLVDGAIDPPVWIGIQAYVESILVGAKWAAVAPMRVGHGIDIDLIEIPLDVDLTGVLQEKVAEFWKRVETNDPYPADYAADGELLKRMYAREIGDPIDLSKHNRIAELCEEKARWAKRRTQCDGALEIVNAEIIEILGDAPAAIHPDWNISRKTQKTKAYQVEASETRVLRVTRKKKAEGEES